MALLALLLAASSGTLAGKVTLNGLAPKLANLPVTRDMKVCGNTKFDESLEVGAGGAVKNVVVYFLDVPLPAEFKPKKEKLDQQQCLFLPHVLATPLGTTVEVVNSDRVLHDVRAHSGEERLMNFAMPIPGHVVPVTLAKEGMFKVECDVHPWMRAWLVVLRTTAYAVTGEDGSYEIRDVPAGKHRVIFWHERLGERDAEVVVPEDGQVTHDVHYTPR